MCDRCGAADHVGRECPHYEAPRLDHPDAAPGDTVPHMHQLAAHREGRLWVIDGRRNVPGHASGAANNCLIDALRQKLNLVGVNVAWVREELRRRFPAPDEAHVSATNFLTLDLHWAAVVDLLLRAAGRGGSEGGGGALDHRALKIVCVDLRAGDDAELRHGDVVGDGRLVLHIGRIGESHFVQLLPFHGRASS